MCLHVVCACVFFVCIVLCCTVLYCNAFLLCKHCYTNHLTYYTYNKCKPIKLVRFHDFIFMYGYFFEVAVQPNFTHF